MHECLSVYSLYNNRLLTGGKCVMYYRDINLCVDPLLREFLFATCTGYNRCKFPNSAVII